MQHTIGYSSGEFVVGQVFNCKYDLQEAANIYSIKAHQEFVVVASSKKLLVLRCKKAEECNVNESFVPWLGKVLAYLLSTNIKGFILVSILA